MRSREQKPYKVRTDRSGASVGCAAERIIDGCAQARFRDRAMAMDSAPEAVDLSSIEKDCARPRADRPDGERLSRCRGATPVGTPEPEKRLPLPLAHGVEAPPGSWRIVASPHAGREDVEFSGAFAIARSSKLRSLPAPEERPRSCVLRLAMTLRMGGVDTGVAGPPSSTRSTAPQTPRAP